MGIVGQMGVRRKLLFMLLSYQSYIQLQFTKTIDSVQFWKHGTKMKYNQSVSFRFMHTFFINFYAYSCKMCKCENQILIILGILGILGIFFCNTLKWGL